MARTNDPLQRYGQAMTPRAELTDDGWRRLQRQLAPQPAPAIRPRWVIATALAAAVIGAVAIGIADVTTTSQHQADPGTQAIDRAATPPADSVDVRDDAPAELPDTPPPSPTARPATQRVPTSPPVEVDPLVAEVALLDRVEQAIAGGRFVLARDLLEQHRREMPRGVMAREASMLRVVVACEVGDARAIAAAVDEHAIAHAEDPALARLRAQPCSESSTSR